VLAQIRTTESEVISRERSISRADATEVAGNATVEANRVARHAVQVVAEKSDAGVELLEDDGLSLDLADLLEDDPLCHLLQDEQALLDDFDGLGVADNLGTGVDLLAEVDGAVEVIGAVEVVEVVERRQATPAVEGDATAGEEIPGKGLGDCASNQSRGDKESGSEFGEHDD